jgi:hypothetical protein
MQMARSSFFGDLAEGDAGRNKFVEFPISAYPNPDRPDSAD